jgi:phage tail sheath protein FI
MDIASYDDDGSVIFAGEANKYPNVDKTIEALESRAIDNDSVAVYYPDITIKDDTNSRLVSVPASTGALRAIGFNDKVAHPWYVPAGVNRGALESVVSVGVRLDTKDQAKLQDAKINPIVRMPAENNQTFFAIMGQKTLKQSKSSLDRVNVRRMVFEVKRTVDDVARRLIFGNDVVLVRKQFVSLTTPLLASVKINQGINKFSIICDERNNTESDVENKQFRAEIAIFPTKASEYISIPFIITESGVQFV